MSVTETTTPTKKVWMNFAAMRLVLTAAPLMVADGLYGLDIFICQNIARHLPSGSDTGWVCQTQLAAESGCSRRQVVDSVRRLIETNYIMKIGRNDQGVNTYKLMIQGGE